MFEKEAKERAKDYTSNKERQVAYECGFLDGVDRMKEIVNASPNLGRGKGYKMCVVDEFHDIKELEKINADLKQSLDWANEREKENTERIVALEKENAEAKGLLKKWQQANICDAVVLFADTEEFLKRG